MLKPIAAGASTAAFALIGWVLPLVFPKLDPWISKSILGVSLALLVVCIVLWALGKKATLEGGIGAPIAQTGDTNAAFTGQINAPIQFGDNYHHYGEPVSQGIPWPINTKPRKPQRDTSVAVAISALYRGEWTNPDIGFCINIDQDRLESVIRHFEQEARDGHVSVWGRDAPRVKDPNDWHTTQEPIAAEHWRRHWIDAGSLHGEPKSAQRPPYPPDNDRYYDLMTCKWQVQRMMNRSKT